MKSEIRGFIKISGFIVKPLVNHRFARPSMDALAVVQSKISHFIQKLTLFLPNQVCSIMTYRYYQGQLRSATSALRKLNISRIALEIQIKSCGFKIERK